MSRRLGIWWESEADMAMTDDMKIGWLIILTMEEGGGP